MLLSSFLLFLGLCQSAILRSKDLQMDFSSQLPTPRDLLKTGLVDKSWIGVQKVFKRITPKAGLFESKQTNEIIFETKKTSWHQNEIVEKMKDSPNFQNCINEKDWNQVFGELAYAGMILINRIWWQGAFLKALAEIVDVGYQFTALHTCAACETLHVSPHLPILHSVAYQHTDEADVAEILLSRGADVDEADNPRRTPLMITAKYGNDNVMETLLRFGANPNLRDLYGRTALHFAAEHDNVPTIEILLNHKAEIGTRDRLLQCKLKDLGFAAKRKRKDKYVKRF